MLLSSVSTLPHLILISIQPKEVNPLIKQLIKILQFLQEHKVQATLKLQAEEFKKIIEPKWGGKVESPPCRRYT